MAYSVVPAVAFGDMWTAANQNTYLKDNFAAVWVGTAAGDVDYYTGAANTSRLPIGTAGQALVVNAGATAPEWGGLPCAKISEGAGQVLATGTEATVTLGDTDHDSNDFVAAPAGNIITIPAGFAGWYLASYFVDFGYEVGGMRRMELRKNVGDTTIDHTRYSIMPVTTIGTPQSMAASSLIHLDAADYVNVNAYQNHGGNLTIAGAALSLVLVVKD